ncbi:hypothetical protein pSalSNUABM01_034 [Salmonella phage pSal-SNUABM-01]|nr:hypothetical protein pSalSNUABM01_034 [Salmonella phage pSal-SNUABM-01]
MNYEELKAKLKELEEEYGDIELEGDEGIILVHEGDWINEGKYEHQETVYADAEKTVFCSVIYGRSGSYFTDWEYLDPQFYEVEPKVISKTIYVGKK